MDVSEVFAEVADQVRLLRRKDFMALLAQGAFEDERVELLCGVVVAMDGPSPSLPNSPLTFPSAALARPHAHSILRRWR